VQALACFLTKGNASSDVLIKIVIEAIVKLENSGLKVDGVTMDGAAWNRQLWAKFGIDENNVSCNHPCDDTRQLYFSDFPHLLKCSRNCATTKKTIPVSIMKSKDNKIR